MSHCGAIGHTGPLKRSETGRPIPNLEDVLLEFPESHHDEKRWN
jgi:hypothetical protein